jgi:hypothetical protein
VKEPGMNMLAAADKEAIAKLIYNWGYFSDHGLWEQLRETFHPEGTICVSWFEGSFQKFVDASIQMSQSPQLLRHNLGTPMIQIKGNHAVSETNVIIMIRKHIGLVDADVTSYARFYDLIEKIGDKWRIVRRTMIFEKDRLDPVQPSWRFWASCLFTDFKKYPAAYRYMAYTAEKTGYKLSPNIVADKSQEARNLYEAGKDWLSG